MCTPQCVFEKLGGLACDEAIKAGKYVVRYAKNLKNMQDEMRDLDDCREDIESKVCEARDRGEEIKVDVLHWQSDVDKLKNDVDRLVGQSTAGENMRCITCSCPNIMRRYRLSKQAEEHAVDANNLIKKSHFEEISRPRPRPPELESLSDNNYVNFDSRASIYKDLMDALKDSNVNMIGVYGLGGVGKTTLVKEVGDQMRQDGTFKQVAFAAVSKDLNVKEVQSKLASSLNLKLKATTDDQEGRRTKLWNKFTNGEKHLIILDDIWEMVDLKKIGIPISDGKTGCKVVLTSRKEDLLRITMKADRNFPIAELPEAEAWDLFNKKVGNYIESRPQIYPLACELCRHCKGLPLAINALGTALQDKPDYTWKNALDKIKKYMLTQIEGIDRGVMATLRVSYDMLWSSDARSCFLLCCLFAEDAEIPIEELTRHCMARRLLAQNPSTFDEARNAVLTVVDDLKSASLLTTGGHENVVKIHDVIRDVGISISRDEKALLIDHGALRWPENPINGPSYSTISLNFKNIKELPDGLVYPQLHTLMVDNSKRSDLEVPDNFFNGMARLTVLSFTKMRMRRLPSSLAKLKELRMLNLNGCELADIATLKDMKSNLEVLSLRGSSIKALSPEIAQLTSLRLLDLRDCLSLTEIPQGIISNLINLEELFFPDKFDQWEAIIDKKKEGTNSSSNNMGLEELRQSLNNGQLTILHIFIPNVKLLPKDGLKFENLKRFRISVGSNFDRYENFKWYQNFKWYENFPGTRVLKHEGSSLRKEFIHLVDKAEALSLIGIKGLKEVLDYRGVGNGFPDLRYLEVKSCDDDLEYFLGEPKSSMQSHRLHPLQSLDKLTRLTIEKCKLRYLFSPTAARGLVHLEELTVRSCEIMEAIVGFEGQNDENELIGDVMFSKLKELVLQKLPNLISFYAEKEKTQTTTGSSSGHPQPLFSNKVILPVLERLQVKALDSIEEIWDKQSPSVNQETESFGQLRNIEVEWCKKLMNLIPSNILPRLRNLQKLTVQGNPNVEFVVFKNKKGEEEAVDDSTLIIPQLWRLWITHMKRLKRFYSSSTTSNAQSLFNHQVAFPALEDLSIWEVPMIRDIWPQQPLSKPEKEVDESFCKLKSIGVWFCHQLEYVLPSYMLPQLHNLLELKVTGCKELEVIVSNKLKEKEATNNDILVFPQLKTLELDSLDNLQCFCTGTDQLLSLTRVTDKTMFKIILHVILPVLEELKVESLDSIEEIWDKQSPSVNQETASFGQLRKMTVKRCTKLVNLGPSNILGRLRNLQDLTVEGCPNVEFIVFKNGKEEKVADDSTLIISQLRRLAIKKLEKLKSFYLSSTTSNAQSLFNHQVIFPVLEELKISEVDSIIEIWDKQSITVFEAEGSFCQLMKVEVSGCNKLTHLFPSKMHKLLKKIEWLGVERCGTMEGVVGFEGEVDEDGLRNEHFSKLTYLNLDHLPKLVSFCTKMGEAGTTEGNPTIHAQPLFNGKVTFLVLEELNISGVDNIIEIWDKQSITVVFETHGSFCQLMNVEVWGCNKLTHLFPSKMHPLLKNLKKLKVGGCETMEGVVGFEEELDEDGLRNEQVIFPVLEELNISEVGNIIEIWDKQSIGLFEAQGSFCQLMNLEVKNCNKLMHLFPSKMHPLLKNLKKLKVGGCETMEGVVGFEEELDEDGLRNEQVAFPALENLIIYEVPMIRDIWPQQPLSKPEKEVESFYKLKSITVWYCQQLEYVLPSYMLPQLHNLLELKVTGCKELEVIVSNKLKEKEATNNDILVFPQLKTLRLQALDNLKCFCTGTDQLLFSHKVVFPALEHLDIIKAPHITEIWDKKPLPEPEKEIDSFCKLATIDIFGCDQLVYVLPSYMLPRLQNLQKLKIWHCKEVEVIVSKELKEKESTDNDPIVFSQLKDVVFRGLPKLKGFYPKKTSIPSTHLLQQLVFSNKVQKSLPCFAGASSDSN
ncbi:hypothetical protein Vadar_012806 [Vaccinium darrowii]|uniref:Uncharacterized protein n=1 Tax=Vaccinium darrowii TaxID=229202 RepID=A0ACB7YL73_9ERIC|nr:hypothetical protein Vadar_012806 [Vaccinium darrowii]